MAAAEALASGHDNNIRARLGFGVRDLTTFVDALRHKREQLLSPALDEAWDSACSATGESPDEAFGPSVAAGRSNSISATYLSTEAERALVDGVHLGLVRLGCSPRCASSMSLN